MLNIYSRPLTVILGTLCLALQYEFWFASGSVSEIWHLKQGISGVQKQNTELVQQNSILAADVEDLKHGDEAIEERARSDLGRIKKHEQFYQIIEVS